MRSSLKYRKVISYFCSCLGVFHNTSGGGAHQSKWAAQTIFFFCTHRKKICVDYVDWSQRANHYTLHRHPGCWLMLYVVFTLQVNCRHVLSCWQHMNLRWLRKNTSFHCLILATKMKKKKKKYNSNKLYYGYIFWRLEIVTVIITY